MSNLPDHRGDPKHLKQVDVAQDEVDGEPEAKDKEDHDAQPLSIVGIHIKEASPEQLWVTKRQTWKNLTLAADSPRIWRVGPLSNRRQQPSHLLGHGHGQLDWVQ